jgi:hypothetical protein
MSIDLSAATEQELREYKVDRPKDLTALVDLLSILENRDHDYGTCVYAMSIAATAAFNYMAGKMGCTGFQASCADLDVIRRTRSIDGPFILLKGEDMLFPQYDLHQKLDEAMTEWLPWAAEQAALKLRESGRAAERVVAHWEKLAAFVVDPAAADAVSDTDRGD